jgi:hypothetical protein
VFERSVTKPGTIRNPLKAIKLAGGQGLAARHTQRFYRNNLGSGARLCLTAGTRPVRKTRDARVLVQLTLLITERAIRRQLVGH